MGKRFFDQNRVYQPKPIDKTALRVMGWPGRRDPDIVAIIPEEPRQDSRIPVVESYRIEELLTGEYAILLKLANGGERNAAECIHDNRWRPMQYKRKESAITAATTSGAKRCASCGTRLT